MRFFFCLSLFTLLFLSGLTQTNNLSFRELCDLSKSASISDIERMVAKYNYTLKDFRKDSIGSTPYEMYLFNKADTHTDDHIWFMKELKSNEAPLVKGFQVSFGTSDNKLFNKFKSELESSKETILLKEEMEGNCFRREYKGVSYTYAFNTCKIKYNDLISLSIHITELAPVKN